MKPRKTSARAQSPTLARAAALLVVTSVAVVACGSDDQRNEPPRGNAGQGGAPFLPSGGGAGVPSGGAEAEAGSSGSSGGTPEAGSSEQGGDEGQSQAGAAGAPVQEHPQGSPVREYPDVVFTYDPPPLPPVTPVDACALGSVQAVPAPLDMYVLLDRSGSMNLPRPMPVGATKMGGGDCNVGDSVASRWCYSINALDAFFGSATAVGTGVALQFFPAGDCKSSESPFLYSCCSSGACCRGVPEAIPMVALSDLPQARGPLAAALNAQVPWADRTPIEAALRGMIQGTASARRPGRQMMGLLITDGGPEGCQSNASALAKLVRDHRTTTGIPTYVVGTTGAAFSWLETIAEAGGAQPHTDRCAGGVSPCHFYSVGSGQPDVFITVLQRIRRSAIACRFEMPKSNSGLIDPKAIQLSFTPTAGGAPVRVNRVNGLSACGPSAGFYYDDLSAPKYLQLCPASCDAFRANDGGKVDILLGCQGS
ncbi:MAG TPA: vWA domain-containing protein [Polyangiaceae bacterium]|nr:vWA domain-containing protein [Polyangiaceae bacterium]